MIAFENFENLNTTSGNAIELNLNNNNSTNNNNNN
jgi:hypothetical protein